MGIRIILSVHFHTDNLETAYRQLFEDMATTPISKYWTSIGWLDSDGTPGDPEELHNARTAVIRDV